MTRRHHPGPVAAAGVALAVTLILLTGCRAPLPVPPSPSPAGPSVGSPTGPAPSTVATTSPTAAMTTDRIGAHLAALQRIADAHGGTRAVGTPGYRASVAHVRSSLERAGYRVTVQEFRYRAERVLAASAEVVTGPVVALQPTVMAGSPSTAGPVTAPLAVPVDPLGCSAGDYRAVADTIVLVERGTCPFALKTRLAADAGAVAVLVHDNQPSTASFRGTVAGGHDLVPVAGIGRAQGMALRAGLEQGPVRLRLELRVEQSPGTTSNVVAEWPGSAPDRDVVMVGAHLDSVPAGPGINDNASGAALVLATAEVLAAHGDPRGLRLGFWGAEEIGLVGSRHYVDGLPPGERDRIAAYLNFDMVASTNGFYGLYGDGAPAEALARAFTERGVDPARADIGGASDHAPFAAVGIPVAGVFTGAGEDKSTRQADRYGGTAGEPYDPCYHRSCDTLDTVDVPVVRARLDVIGDVAVEAVGALLESRAR